MLSINLVVNILIGCAFVFMFLANISTAEKKRLKYVWAAVVVFVCVSGMYLFNREKISLAQMTYFVGFGAIWPQLMSRIFILHQIQSPVEYMNRRLSAGSMILGLTVLAFFSFFILMILQPNRINYVTGEAIYREEDVQFKISYLFLLLPGAITFFIFFIQRTAFCANGLLYGGYFSTGQILDRISGKTRNCIKMPTLHL